MIVNCLLPEENCLPAKFSFIHKMKKQLSETSLEAEELSRGEICYLGFPEFLKNILERDLEAVFSYSEHKETSVVNDFPLDKTGLVIRCSKELEIQLMLSTDGVSFVNSTNTSLWPFWLAIANLPPKLRMAQKNICLAALFVGQSKYHGTK